MKRTSTSTDAIAWMMARRGRTQTDASDKFGISQGAISSTKSREDRAILLCERIPEVTEKAYQILKDDPTRTARSVAYKLGLSDVDARALVLGIHAKTVRETAVFRESDANMSDVPPGLEAASRFGYDAGKREGRLNALEDAAFVAEAVGGEYGAAIALVLRGMS